MLSIINFKKYQLSQMFGYGIIFSTLIATILIWLFTLKSHAFIYSDFFLFCSKFVVLLGMVAMCWTFILATRLKFLEELFVGLDKVYQVHKFLGKFSFVCIFLHPMFQIFRFISDWNRVFTLILPNQINGEFFGIIAFVLFFILIALTLWIQIPYHIWKRSHELFIFVLIFTFLHVFIINKHVNSSMFLSVWIYGFMVLAGISYIYIRFLYRFFGPRYEYVIEKIENIRKTWNIFLKPKGLDFLTFNPGQFVYVSFAGSGISKEVHPYSISNYSTDGKLRLSIKELGDYTSKLNNLKVGDLAFVWGPYGKFYEKFLFNSKDSVFIAGGIGVTPFLSMLNYKYQNSINKNSYIFYCVKNPERADFKNEIIFYSKLKDNIVFYPHYSHNQCYLTLKEIKEVAGSLKDKNFFICGPKVMMDSFIHQLNQVGVKNYNIVYEDFNFKN